jgi:tryptophan halogenase
MLPGGKISERDIAEFNDQQFLDMEQIRDFLILHYHVTERRDSPFWRHCAALPIPESLEQKIELFRETGRVFRKNEELFVENSWVQVMMGQGVMPRAYHPIAQKLRPDELDSFLRMLRDGVAHTLSGLPAHQAYIARYCAARQPEPVQ